jgi:UDP-glucose 4-epimerase
MKCLVTGGAGFIGSHLVDALIRLGHEVTVLDNFLSGFEKNINKQSTFYKCDIRNKDSISNYFKNIDVVFHLAAIARTPWCVEDPVLAYETNVMGTLNVLESARLYSVKRVIMTSSNVVYAFWTPYRSSKEALEALGKVYVDMYGMSVICLRNSNVYGSRQSELGPSPNVFSALRKSKKENGYIEITGDGTQSRDFTHVSDIVLGHIAAMNNSTVTGVFDLCTGTNHALNKIATYFNCAVKYLPERPGDVKHIYQDPNPAYAALGWKAIVNLEDGMKDFMGDKDYSC